MGSKSQSLKAIKNIPSLYDIFFKNGLYRIVILLVLCVGLSIASSAFLSVSNMLNVARQASILLILAVGATGTILTKGIDLSLAGVMSLAGCVCGYLMNHNVHPLLACLAALLVGVGFGFLNGILIAVVKIPAFVSTYGVKYIANGLALMLMGSNIFFGFPSRFLFMGVGYVGFIPAQTVWAIMVTFVLYVFLQKSKFGRRIYCVGANSTAAYYSGINTTSTYLVVYIISSTCAAFAGILQIARMNAAQAGLGDSFQMLAIASIVIGGTSMAGGEGNVVGCVIGALILTLIVNGMNLLGITAQAQPLITGIVIVLAVLLDTEIKRIENKRVISAKPKVENVRKVEIA